MTDFKKIGRASIHYGSRPNCRAGFFTQYAVPHRAGAPPVQSPCPETATGRSGHVAKRVRAIVTVIRSKCVSVSRRRHAQDPRLDERQCRGMQRSECPISMAAAFTPVSVAVLKAALCAACSGGSLTSAKQFHHRFIMIGEV